MSSKTGGGQSSTTARSQHLLTCPRKWATSISFRGLATRHITQANTVLTEFIVQVHSEKNGGLLGCCHADFIATVCSHPAVLVTHWSTGIFAFRWDIEWQLLVTSVLRYYWDIHLVVASLHTFLLKKLVRKKGSATSFSRWPVHWLYSLRFSN